MIPEILDSANAMGRCIRKKSIEIEQQKIVERLTAQNVIHIDSWVGFLKQFPRAYDTWSGIDQGTIHIEETK